MTDERTTGAERATAADRASPAERAAAQRATATERATTTDRASPAERAAAQRATATERGTTSDPPADSPPALAVSDLDVAYGDAPVLEAVDATVAAGELVGLVGPNGAGKTTLLHAISGAVERDAGTVRVQGEEVRDLSSAAASRRIAVVPQETALPFSFPVRRLVAMGRHPHRSRFAPPTEGDRALVERAMERTETAHLAGRPVDALSGGQRQRVLLARALAQDAPLLLLDEPTASLDVNHAVETLALVRELVDDDRAAVAAIHDLELAARFCDRLLLLADGEVVARGPPGDVLDPARVRAAFDATVAVEPEPIGGGVTVEPLAGSATGAGTSDDARSRPTGCSVHVVGSGDAAAAALGALGDAGVGRHTDEPDGGTRGEVDGGSRRERDGRSRREVDGEPRDETDGAPGDHVGGGSRDEVGGASDRLSLGPVPNGDRAATTARALDAHLITVPPFEPVADDALERARTAAASADAVVLAASSGDHLPPAWCAVCDAADAVVRFQGDHQRVSTDGHDAADDATCARRIAARVEPVASADRDDLPAVVRSLAAGDWRSAAHANGDDRPSVGTSPRAADGGDPASE